MTRPHQRRLHHRVVVRSVVRSVLVRPVLLVVVRVAAAAVKEKVLPVLLILPFEEPVVHVPRVRVEHVILRVRLSLDQRAVAVLVVDAAPRRVPQRQVRDCDFLKPHASRVESGDGGEVLRRCHVVVGVVVPDVRIFILRLHERRVRRGVGRGVDAGFVRRRIRVFVVVWILFRVLRIPVRIGDTAAGHRGECARVIRGGPPREHPSSSFEGTVRGGVVPRALRPEIPQRGHLDEIVPPALHRLRVAVVAEGDLLRDVRGYVPRVTRRAEVQARGVRALPRRFSVSAVSVFVSSRDGCDCKVVKVVILALVEEPELAVALRRVRRGRLGPVPPPTRFEDAAAAVARAASLGHGVRVASHGFAVVGCAGARGAPRVAAAVLGARDPERFVEVERGVAEVGEAVVERADPVFLLGILGSGGGWRVAVRLAAAAPAATATSLRRAR